MIEPGSIAVSTAVAPTVGYAEPAVGVVVEPVAGIDAEPVAETAVEPVAETAVEPVVETAVEPVAGTVVETVAGIAVVAGIADDLVADWNFDWSLLHCEGHRNTG